ncbi:uncharacterized protein LOC143247268 isoform X2 [Tachypleus tridentatus]
MLRTFLWSAFYGCNTGLGGYGAEIDNHLIHKANLIGWIGTVLLLLQVLSLRISFDMYETLDEIELKTKLHEMAIKIEKKHITKTVEYLELDQT